jgi:hypothetical protein
MKKQLWFKRRRYGWGWVPATWQGWFLLLLHLAVVVFVGFVLLGDDPEVTPAQNVVFFFLVLGISTVSLIGLAYLKGPIPRWRWGARPNDDPEEDW